MCFRFRDSKTNIERTSKGNITGTFLPGMKITIEAEELTNHKKANFTFQIKNSLDENEMKNAMLRSSASKVE